MKPRAWHSFLFSINMCDFLNTYNVAGMAAGGGGEEMAGTKPLLSRPQGSLSARREEEKESDGGRCYFIFYGGQSRLSQERTFERRPEDVHALCGSLGEEKYRLREKASTQALVQDVSVYSE